MTAKKTVKPKESNPKTDDIVVIGPKSNAAASKEVPRSLAGSFPVVGIGASAGGLSAFESFFSGMPKDRNPDMAFILVQHLSPDHKSILDEIIGRYTRMKVFEVTEGMVVKPNCAYIIPPNRDMALVGGKLHLLEPASPHGQRLPIDFFFHSLAQELQDQSIGVILSGTGSDGTKGLREIKEAGGMTIAQKIGSAEYDGMPKSAIDLGIIDYELLPNEMANQIISYVSKSLTIRQKSEAEHLDKNETALKKIFALVRAKTGHDFSKYKVNTIYRRIERRLVVHQIESMDDYIKFLQQTPAEIEALFRDLLIGVTKFFRDPEVFDAIKERVIPAIFANKSGDDSVRIWIPGCSTGEEAYSIAIIIKEYIEKVKADYIIQIFATDIDSQAIAIARAGLYLPNIRSDISTERLSRFFTFLPERGAYQIKKSIRDMLIFSEQSVIKDPPFSKMDLISCRNLLIYLNVNLQKKVIAMFHYALSPKGMLVLGTSETVGEFDSIFEPIDSKLKIYQRKEDLLMSKRLSINSLTDTPILREVNATPRISGKLPFASKISLNEIVEKGILQVLEPVGVLVSEIGDILYLYGRSGLYLEPTPGEIGIPNILKMAREGLVAELTIALNNARKTKEIINQPRLKVKTNGHFTLVNLTVKPIDPKLFGESEKPIYLVILGKALDPEVGIIEELISKSKTKPTGKADIEELKREIIVKEEYLKNANEELETSNEDLKSANEEMQSVNEELQSTNEELETSKEELQSVNEELATVNAEMENKISDLSQINNDMNNLLAGTNIATVFVNHQLNVTRFTPTATRLINLIASDVGRPLSHVVSNLIGYSNLASDIQEVLDTLVPIELQVQATDTRWYVMRIQPYRTIENVIEGAVVTFVDITNIKNAEESLAFSEAAYRRLFETAKEGILIIDPETGKIMDANPFLIELLGFTQDQLINKTIWDIGEFKDIAASRDKFLLLQQNDHIKYDDLPLVTADGRKIEVEFNNNLYKVGSRSIIHCHIRDITGKKKTQEALKQSEKLK